MHSELHNDKKVTLVQIGNLLYELVPSTITVEQVKSMPYDQVPHVRFLNPIPIRSKEDQEKRNKDNEGLHKLYQKAVSKRNSTQTIEDVVEGGGEITETIKKLLAEKATAKKSGDRKKLRLIRKQLRKLDYKRYVSKKAKQ